MAALAAGVAVLGIWFQTIPGRAGMSDLINTARELCAAESVGKERDLVTKLQSLIASTENVSIDVVADLASGGSVDLTTLSDASGVETITLKFQIGDKEEIVGPCRPKDANAYFDLFLE